MRLDTLHVTNRCSTLFHYYCTSSIGSFAYVSLLYLVYLLLATCLGMSFIHRSRRIVYSSFFTFYDAEYWPSTLPKYNIIVCFLDRIYISTSISPLPYIIHIFVGLALLYFSNKLLYYTFFPLKSLSPPS